ncbi:Hsp70 family protein, partial [Candidatus Microgenomates bacterium]|nr:Hsp70 family protein [Candidatus Microgenomates bacterium]
RNSTVPTSKSQVFSTAADNQTSVEINILQGERPMAADNKSLGRFILDGIPPAPRGVPQIEVTFDIDANGILNVTAKDKATGKAQSIKITGSTGLSKDEIDKMTREAETHADEDKEKMEKVETRNKADTLIFTAEKSLKDAGDKVPADVKKNVEEKVAALKSILDTGSKDELNAKSEELSQVLSQIGSNMYQNQGQPNVTPENEVTDSNKEGTTNGENKGKEGDVEEGQVVQ